MAPKKTTKKSQQETSSENAKTKANSEVQTSAKKTVKKAAAKTDVAEKKAPAKQPQKAQAKTTKTQTPQTKVTKQTKESSVLGSKAKKTTSKLPQDVKINEQLTEVSPTVGTAEAQESTPQKAPILTKGTDPVPEYVEDRSSSTDLPQKKPSFERIVPYDIIVDALKKSSTPEPTELLQAVCPTSIRGNDILLFKTKKQEGVLIGVLPFLCAKYSAQDPSTPNTKKIAVFVSSSDLRAKESHEYIKSIFDDSIVTTEVLVDDESTAKLTSQSSFEILFTSVERLVQLKETFNFENIGLFFIQDFQNFENQKYENLLQILSLVPKRNAQKIIVSSVNSSKVRECAFRFLDYFETFSFITPVYKSQTIKQYGHALEVTQKFQVLLGYIKTFKPRCACVVANTQTVAEWIAFKLNGNGVKVELLQKDTLSEKREEIIASSKNATFNVVVATDDTLKNFGLEVINCIYHFDLPNNPENYAMRLSKMENSSKMPISVAFICEDYGFNISKIEEKLGIKLRITQPDKNFFSIKDISEYPLEADGRVKKIGGAESKPQEQRIVSGAHVQQAPTAQQKPIAEQPVAPAQQHVAAIPAPVQETVSQQQETVSTQQHHQQKRTQHYQPDTSKFVRRDERAREVVEGAKTAAKAAAAHQSEAKQTFESAQSAQNQRTEQQFNTEHARDDQHTQPSLLGVALNIVQDAFVAAAFAARESVIQNVQDNLPKFSAFLNRFKFMKPSQDQERNETQEKTHRQDKSRQKENHPQ